MQKGANNSFETRATLELTAKMENRGKKAEKTTIRYPPCFPLPRHRHNAAPQGVWGGEVCTSHGGNEDVWRVVVLAWPEEGLTTKEQKFGLISQNGAATLLETKTAFRQLPQNLQECWEKTSATPKQCRCCYSTGLPQK